MLVLTSVRSLPTCNNGKRGGIVNVTKRKSRVCIYIPLHNLQPSNQRHQTYAMRNANLANGEGEVQRTDRQTKKRKEAQVTCIMLSLEGACYLRPITPAPPPTATLCFPNQPLGASLRRCKMTVLLCNLDVMSYHAEVMS